MSVMPTPEYIIRLATALDHQALTSLARSTVDEIQGAHADRRLGSELSPKVFEPNKVIFVGETKLDRKLVGFVIIEFNETQDSSTSLGARVANISLLGVSVELRRRGLAQNLMKKAVEQAREWKSTRITLEVSEHNQAAIMFYESIGWKLFHRVLIFTEL